MQEHEPQIVARILAQRPTPKLQIPGLDYFLQDVEVPAYAYDKTFDEARHLPFVVLQTSGSTGLPKPVVVNHGTLSSMDAYHIISYLGGDAVIGPSLKGSRMLMAFPLFHMASFTLLLGYSAYYGIIGVLPPPVEPITAHLVDAIQSKTGIHGSALPPSLLCDLYHEEAFHPGIARLEYVFYAGGSLPTEAGKKISTLTNLATLVGSTEIGYPPMRVTGREDWQYVSYSPFNGHVFRPSKEKGLYEHVVVRRDYLDIFQGIFSTYPNLQEFPTRDVYRRHANKPNLWKFCGRMDDVIVFSNAEKFYPGDFEETISFHPAVKSVIMGGHGEFQSCLLVEPTKDIESDGDRMELLNEIWPKVQEANETIPAHARVLKDFILLTRKEKPVERADKGTVQRTTTLQLYQEEIAGLYRSPELPKIIPEMLVATEVQRPRKPREVLYEILSASVNSKDELADDTDFFDLGLDSLQTLALCKRINAYLMQTAPTVVHVTPNTIYTHSNMEKLASFLEPAGKETVKDTDDQRMQRIFDECSSTLPEAPRPHALAPSQRSVVLLTGSTGSLGSYILEALLRNPAIDKIYCLNREKDARSRQTSMFETRGLNMDLQSVLFIQCDLGKQQLGISGGIYSGLLQEVTHVIHNAWDVNFMRSLGSFINVHIRGVCRIIEFCANSRSNAHLFFISSESAVLGRSNSCQGRVKEEIVRDWSHAQQIGYAQSKLVAERLIDRASRMCDLQSSIARIGQIAGPTGDKGVWNTQEWFPSLVASSVWLQRLPDSLGIKDVVDWVPVDIVGRVVVELLFGPTQANRRAGGQRSPEPRSTDGNGNPLIETRMENPALPDSPDQRKRHSQSAVAAEDYTSPRNANQAWFSGSPTLARTDDDVEQSASHLRAEPSRAKSEVCHRDSPPNPAAPTVYHITNPISRPWKAVAPVIQGACSTPLQLVPLPSWLEALAKEMEGGRMREGIPVRALLDLLENAQQVGPDPNAWLDISHAIERSESLAGVGAVGDEWIRTWMRQWGIS